MKKTSSILVLSLLACSGEALDVGEDGSPVGASGGTGSSAAQDAAAIATIPDWTQVGACPTTGIDAPQFVGTWEGAVEDYYLNPVTPLRLVITKATSDGVCGTLSWGSTTTPPIPLTDPEQSGQQFGYGGGSGQPVLGLTYTISRGAARDATLRIGAPAFEHWREFCAMQTDLHYTPNLQAYTCMEPYSSMTFPDEGQGFGDTCVLDTSHGPVEHPLKQCAACDNFICKCNAEGCAATPDQTFDFDLTLDRSFAGDDIMVSPQALLGQQAIHLERVD